MATINYKAFISYSHRDETWVAELHKTLETFKVPRRLVGTQGTHGLIPGKLFPVFRDRDELSSGTDLSEKVREALDHSAALIVVCSPESARSMWVNEEIRYFRSIGRGARIYCVIIAGDPQPMDPAEQCFPPALFESEDGRRNEPMAADARKWGDGKSLAILKLVSAVLGIRLDELRMRAQRRKRRLQIFAITAAMAITALIVITVVSKVTERSRLEYAEALVSQMVAASADLEKVADLETLRGISERLASYLETLDQKDLTRESRKQVGLVLRQLGQVSRSQGRPDEAMDAFLRSREVFSGLLKDQPDNLDAMFELGQAEFWVGYLHVDKGDWDAGTEANNHYLEISRKLLEAEPENAEWAMEVAYALSNLGMISGRRSPTDPELTLGHLESAMEYNRLASELAPDDEYYRVELSDSYANLADAWLDVCNVGEALSSRVINVSYAKDFYLLEPGNNRVKAKYAYSLAGLAWTQQLVGLVDEAMSSLEQSVALLSELAREDPSNLTFRWNLHRKTARIAALMALSGREDESWSLSASVESELRQLLIEDQSVSVVNGTDFALFLLRYAELAHHRGDAVLSSKWLREGILRLQEILKETPDNKEALLQMRGAVYTAWVQNNRSLPPDPAILPYADPSRIENPRSCEDAVLAAQLSVVQGDLSAASDYTQYLLEKGFNEPAFRRFCREQALCKP